MTLLIKADNRKLKCMLEPIVVIIILIYFIS